MASTTQVGLARIPDQPLPPHPGGTINLLRSQGQHPVSNVVAYDPRTRGEPHEAAGI
jgi:hypothetical protein